MMKAKAKLALSGIAAVMVSTAGYVVVIGEGFGKVNDGVSALSVWVDWMTDGPGYIKADEADKSFTTVALPLLDSLTPTVKHLSVRNTDLAAARLDPQHYDDLTRRRSQELLAALSADDDRFHEADKLVQNLDRALGCLAEGCNINRYNYHFNEVTCVVGDLYADFIAQNRNAAHPNYANNVIAAKAKLDCKAILYDPKKSDV